MGEPVSAPRMVIVAGPPGGGKSSLFPVRNSGLDWYNSDDRAAQLNNGSYHNIPPHIRAAAGQQLQHFIDTHIDERRSFAFENALRTPACFEQIRRAKDLGFRVRMNYLAAGPVEEHIKRVKNRAALGGHSASERKLRDIYENSLKNLVIAFAESSPQHIDLFRVFDNSKLLDRPRLVVSMAGGVLKELSADVPVWLQSALESSPFNIPALRREFELSRTQ